MPKAAAAIGAASEILPLQQIAARIVRACNAINNQGSTEALTT